MRQTRWAIPARGSRSFGKDRETSERTRRVAIQFDQEMFEAIRKRAFEHDTSFAEQVRILVEWGMESADSTYGRTDPCTSSVRSISAGAGERS